MPPDEPEQQEIPWHRLGQLMGDDTCKPHVHGETHPCTSHHFFPIAATYPYLDRVSDYGQVWRCLGCGGERESVVSADVSRRQRDRVP